MAGEFPMYQTSTETLYTVNTAITARNSETITVLKQDILLSLLHVSVTFFCQGERRITQVLKVITVFRGKYIRTLVESSLL